MVLERRVAIPELAGTALDGPFRWFAALDETQPPAVHTPAAPADSVRILATVSGMAVLEGVHGETHLRRGGIVLLDAGWTYRRRINREPWRVRALLLRGAWAERLSRRLAAADGVAEYRRPPPAWREHIAAAVEACLGAQPGWDWVAMAELARLMRGLCAAEARLADGLLAQVLGLVGAEPDRAWRVSLLARAVGCSESAFAHRFAAETGIAPARWLRRWRIAQARRLLAEHGPGEVAEMLGFCSSFHFSRVFRRETGMPPSAWRDRARI